MCFLLGFAVNLKLTPPPQNSLNKKFLKVIRLREGVLVILLSKHTSVVFCLLDSSVPWASIYLLSTLLCLKRQNTKIDVVNKFEVWTVPPHCFYPHVACWFTTVSTITRSGAQGEEVPGWTYWLWEEAVVKVLLGLLPSFSRTSAFKALEILCDPAFAASEPWFVPVLKWVKAYVSELVNSIFR